MYDTDISASTLSAITDKVIPLVKEWQVRPLEDTYCIVWLDGMHYKVKQEGRIQNRCVYNILGITTEGRKEILGMYVSESEGAHLTCTRINFITKIKIGNFCAVQSVISHRNWGTGESCNNGTHEIDCMRWALDVNYPSKVVSGGGRYAFDNRRS